MEVECLQINVTVQYFKPESGDEEWHGQIVNPSSAEESWATHLWQGECETNIGRILITYASENLITFQGSGSPQGPLAFYIESEGS